MPAARTPIFPFVAGQSESGRELLLDTTVDIDVLQSRTPVEIDQLLQKRIVNYSTVALAELTRLLGALDPAHPGTDGVMKPLGLLPARRRRSKTGGRRYFRSEIGTKSLCGSPV